MLVALLVLCDKCWLKLVDFAPKIFGFAIVSRTVIEHVTQEDCTIGDVVSPRAGKNLGFVWKSLCFIVRRRQT